MTPPPNAAPMPRNVVVILLDSLNRHLLGAYGFDEFDTPNLDRLAARSVRFDRHYTGSLPCMPARHDILCGALDFLWRPWGSVEIWEDAITYHLRRSGVTTMLVSDHPHLFEAGGENYHTDFDAWEYVRGHEGDPWRTAPDPSWAGTPALPAREGWIHHAYDHSRTWFRAEEDFPGARTMTEAARWLSTQAPAADRFLLFVDEFDPHEPFDVPEPWMSMYDPDWEGDKLIWPPYSTDTLVRGVLDERSAHHIRANYGAKLSFIDHQLGKILAELDRQDLWSDTAVVLCTDHGHYLGEHDAFGKPGLPVYQTLGHIPLFIAWPGHAPGAVDALTTSVDIFATLCDVFDVTPQHRTHGQSLVPLLADEARAVRDWVLTGVWGNTVQLVDGTRKYVRSPAPENRPLSMWSNRWSSMPVHAFPELRLPRPDRRAVLDFMPGSEVPVLRQPFDAGDAVPMWAASWCTGHHEVYDVESDPGETRNLAGTSTETELEELLRVALTSVEAPANEFERLGL